MSESFASSPLRVVVAEDDGTLALLLRLSLHADERFRLVAVVGDGESALAAVDRHDPDVLVLDLGLPVLDGFDVLDRLGSARDGRPTTVVISSVGHTDRARAMGAGAHAYLDKLEVADDLAGAIHHAAVRGRSVAS